MIHMCLLLTAERFSHSYMVSLALLDRKGGSQGPGIRVGSGKDTQEQAIHAASHLSEMIFLG